LVGCDTPNDSATDDKTPQKTEDASQGDKKDIPSESSDTGTLIAAKDLKRDQFLRAMSCALEKAPATQKVVFSSQIAVYTPESSETTFNTIMGIGGGGQYEAYKQSVTLGCPG